MNKNEPVKPKKAPGSNVPPHEIHPGLTEERLQWLALLERLGPLEWKVQLAEKAAAHCRENGWTTVRFDYQQGKVLHELTSEGRDLLFQKKRADKEAFKRARLKAKQVDHTASKTAHDHEALLTWKKEVALG